jgi:hypothetical protein
LPGEFSICDDDDDDDDNDGEIITSTIRISKINGGNGQTSKSRDVNSLTAETPGTG